MSGKFEGEVISVVTSTCADRFAIDAKVFCELYQAVNTMREHRFQVDDTVERRMDHLVARWATVLGMSGNDVMEMFCNLRGVAVTTQQ